jgi:hypothetical protein
MPSRETIPLNEPESFIIENLELEDLGVLILSKQHGARDDVHWFYALTEKTSLQSKPKCAPIYVQYLKQKCSNTLNHNTYN